MDAYLEVGAKRVFAAVVDWPGWCRSGRSEDLALQTLAGYAPRYAAAIELAVPEPVDLQVVERMSGTSTTDFGAPARAPSRDEERLAGEELDRHVELLRRCWAAFDRVVSEHGGAALRKGPRGGGRELDDIVKHVLDAEASYLRALGGRSPEGDVDALRAAAVEAVQQRARGALPDVGPRGGKRWSARWYIRRATWHVLDHAWEIEDRAT